MMKAVMDSTRAEHIVPTASPRSGTWDFALGNHQQTTTTAYLARAYPPVVSRRCLILRAF